MSAVDSLADVRKVLHERLLHRVDARELEGVSRAERRLRVREEALAVLREQGHILPQGALAKMVNEVSDAVVGMGPIEFLLKDPDVTEGLSTDRARRAKCYCSAQNSLPQVPRAAPSILWNSLASSGVSFRSRSVSSVATSRKFKMTISAADMSN